MAGVGIFVTKHLRLESPLTAASEITKAKDPVRRSSISTNGRTRPNSKSGKLLVVVNPYATTVSDRLKSLVLYALRSGFQVDSVETEYPNHAEELAKEAANDGFDLVVAFGGDGTVNEIANGLYGSDVPLAVLPGGSTNVFCRALKVPNDIVAATEHLLGLATTGSLRKVDLGCVNGRYFVFGSGIGIDADAVGRVDSRPRIKARFGEFFYSYQLLETFFRRYRGKPPMIEVEVDGEKHVEAVTAVIQNTDPYTYFGKRKLEVCEGVELNSGTLSYVALKRALLRDLPSIAIRLLTEKSAGRHRQAVHAERIRNLTVRSIQRDHDGKLSPFPLHVDGDYIGSFTEARYSILPKALTVLS